MKRFTKVEQSKLGRWLREYKAIVAASAGGGVLILLTACKMLKREDGEKEDSGRYAWNEDDDLANEIKRMDEELFTKIAPAIEEALVNDTITTYHDEIRFPNLEKKLNINITEL